MSQKYKKIFSFSIDDKAPERVFSAVLKRIEDRKTKQEHAKAFAHGLLAIIAVIAIVPAISYFISEATQSGFLQYLSLVFSDGSAILSDWKDLTMSILESIPIISSISCLALIFIIANSLRRGAEHISPKVRSQKNIISFA